MKNGHMNLPAGYFTMPIMQVRLYYYADNKEAGISYSKKTLELLALTGIR
jgi:hypothetical protein